MTPTRQSNSKASFHAAIPWLVVAVISGCSNSEMTKWQNLETAAQKEAKAGNSSEAEKLFLQAIKKADELQNTEIIVTSLLGLSDFYYQAGKSEQCLPLLTRAHALGEKQLKECSGGTEEKRLWSELTARCALARANAFREQGKYFESDPLYKRAAELVSTGHGAELTTSRATTTTGDTTTSTTDATTTTGATRTTSDTDKTVTEAELLATIKKEAALMEEYRHKSDDVLDEMVLAGKQVVKSNQFKDRDIFDRTASDYAGLQNLGRSSSNEDKLKGRVAQAKALFGIHEGRYRLAVSALYFYYVNNREFGKARALVKNDLKEFEGLEKMTLSDLELDPEKLPDLQILATDLYLLGDLFSREGYDYTAIQYRERGLVLRERWGPKSWEFVSMRRGLADAYCAVHNYPAAIEQLDRALPLHEEVRKKSPKQFQYLDQRYLILASMASIEQLEGSYHEAARHLKEARAVLDMRSFPEPDLMANYLTKCADLAGATGQFKEQRNYVEAVINYWKTHSTNNKSLPVLGYLHAGQYYYANHDYAASIKRLQMALEQIKRNPDNFSRGYLHVDVLQWLALATACTGDIDSAERILKEAKSIFVERKVINPKLETQLAVNAANIKRRAGQFAQAQELFTSAESISRKVPSESPDYRWSVLFYQVANEWALNNYDTAHSIGIQALELARESQYRSDLVARSLILLARTQLLQGDTASAQRYLDEAEQVCNSSLVPNYEILADIHVNRARNAFIRQQDSKASAELDKARRFFQKANANFENILYEWELEYWLRHNRRPSATAEIAQEQLMQIVDDLKSEDRAFQPVCGAQFGAAALIWNGRTAEGRHLEKLACQIRDDQLKRRKVR